jgi:hypothetical protein
MAGLDPAIHVFLAVGQDVDARDKPGHDEFNNLIQNNFETRNPSMALVLTEEQSMLRDSARVLIS